MKQRRSFLAAVFCSGLLLAAFIGLSSWGVKPPSVHFTGNPFVTDTVPDEPLREKKIRDIDDAIKELDKAKIQLDKSMKMDMEKIQEELAESMKQLDVEKIRLQVEEGLKKVDMEKIQQQIKESMEEAKKNMEISKVDMEKMKAEMEKALAKVDMEKIKQEMEKAKQIDYKKIQEEMEKAREEIQEKMPDMKKELEKAQLEIEKAKGEMLETKAFIDGLAKDGLIDKNGDYTIKGKNGELFINGEKQPEKVYNKYRNYLDKKKTFTIRKNEDGFNINTGDDVRKI